jgi:hypothetical protein
VGDVNTGPLAVELLRRRYRRAAAAERVQHHIPFVGGRLDDAFQQRQGFLGGVAEAYIPTGLPDWIDVVPNILESFSK